MSVVIFVSSPNFTLRGSEVLVDQAGGFAEVPYCISINTSSITDSYRFSVGVNPRLTGNPVVASVGHLGIVLSPVGGIPPDVIPRSASSLTVGAGANPSKVAQPDQEFSYAFFKLVIRAQDPLSRVFQEHK